MSKKRKKPCEGCLDGGLEHALENEKLNKARKTLFNFKCDCGSIFEFSHKYVFLRCGCGQIWECKEFDPRKTRCGYKRVKR